MDVDVIEEFLACDGLFRLTPIVWRRFIRQCFSTGHILLYDLLPPNPTDIKIKPQEYISIADPLLGLDIHWEPQVPSYKAQIHYQDILVSTITVAGSSGFSSLEADHAAIAEFPQIHQYILWSLLAARIYLDNEKNHEP